MTDARNDDFVAWVLHFFRIGGAGQTDKEQQATSRPPGSFYSVGYQRLSEKILAEYKSDFPL